MTMTQEWLQVLNSAGFRVTRPLRAVVEVLTAAERALTPTDVYDLARRTYARIGLTTVYRSLDKLEDAGLIERVHQPDGCHAYVAAVEGHQHLLICRHCQRTQYFHGDDLEPLMRLVSQESGYDIHTHWLQFFGLCPECRPSA